MKRRISGWYGYGSSILKKYNGCFEQGRLLLGFGESGHPHLLGILLYLKH